MHTHDRPAAGEKPSYYVILAPERKDFLSLYDTREGQTLLGWHEDPENAVQFSEYEDAEPVAQQILANMTDPQNEQYRIVICAVFTRGSQLLVKSVEEPFAVELPPISPEAKAALPAFVELLRVAGDEQWPHDQIERYAGALAREHQLRVQQLAEVLGCAALVHAHELGDEDLADQYRQMMLRAPNPSDN
jgi:hypothetical protein